MKNTKLLFGLLLISLIFSSCAKINHPIIANPPVFEPPPPNTSIVNVEFQNFSQSLLVQEIGMIDSRNRKIPLTTQNFVFTVRHVFPQIIATGELYINWKEEMNNKIRKRSGSVLVDEFTKRIVFKVCHNDRYRRKEWRAPTCLLTYNRW